MRPEDYEANEVLWIRKFTAVTSKLHNVLQLAWHSRICYRIRGITLIFCSMWDKKRSWCIVILKRNVFCTQFSSHQLDNRLLLHQQNKKSSNVWINFSSRAKRLIIAKRCQRLCVILIYEACHVWCSEMCNLCWKKIFTTF